MISYNKDQYPSTVIEPDDPERSDPSVNVDALPKDHPIHLLAEARRYYGDDRKPPFLLNKRPEAERRKDVVIPTKHGLRPKREKTKLAQIVAMPIVQNAYDIQNYLKDWDEHFMFWTLDLDGTRYMVKPLIGAGGGGMRYLYWAGPGKDFEEKPLALSFLSSPQPNSISSTVREGPSLHPINRKRRILTDDYETSDSDSSIETSESDLEGNATRPRSLTQHGVDAGPGIPSRQMDDCGSRAMGYANALTQPTVPHSNPAKKRTTEISGPLVGRRSGEHRPGPTQPTREETIKQKYKTRIENQLDREFDQIFTPWAGDDQDVGRDTLLLILKVIDIMKDSSPQNIARTLNRALNGGTGKREDTGGRRPTGIWFKSLKADLEDAKTTSNNGGTTNIHSLSSANPQPRNHIKLRRTEVESGQGSSSDPQSTPFDGNRQQLDPDQNLDISPPTILSQHKQNLTTLIVRVAPFVKYQPVELSECMALKSFYAEVLGAWGIRGESVAEITVTFTWKDPEDPMRMMVMNSKNKACFAHLIKQVDHAPGWEEGDEEHLVDVEIVLKE